MNSNAKLKFYWMAQIHELKPGSGVVEKLAASLGSIEVAVEVVKSRNNQVHRKSVLTRPACCTLQLLPKVQCMSIVYTVCAEKAM
jgi:hypothetical protein